MTYILSIDDSKAVHGLLSAILETGPVKLSHAFDGLEGIQLLETQKQSPPDLVLLDWEMPKLNGAETLRKIREAGLKVPVIMLTSKNNPDEIMQILSLGANEYVMKPFTRDILIDKIEMVLGRKLG